MEKLTLSLPQVVLIDQINNYTMSIRLVNYIPVAIEHFDRRQRLQSSVERSFEGRWEMLPPVCKIIVLWLYGLGLRNFISLPWYGVGS